MQFGMTASVSSLATICMMCRAENIYDQFNELNDKMACIRAVFEKVSDLMLLTHLPTPEQYTFRFFIPDDNSV